MRRLSRLAARPGQRLQLKRPQSQIPLRRRSDHDRHCLPAAAWRSGRLCVARMWRSLRRRWSLRQQRWPVIANVSCVSAWTRSSNLPRKGRNLPSFSRRPSCGRCSFRGRPPVAIRSTPRRRSAPRPRRPQTLCCRPIRLVSGAIPTGSAAAVQPRLPLAHARVCGLEETPDRNLGFIRIVRVH